MEEKVGRCESLVCVCRCVGVSQSKQGVCLYLCPGAVCATLDCMCVYKRVGCLKIKRLSVTCLRLSTVEVLGTAYRCEKHENTYLSIYAFNGLTHLSISIQHMIHFAYLVYFHHSVIIINTLQLHPNYRMQYKTIKNALKCAYTDVYLSLSAPLNIYDASKQ